MSEGNAESARRVAVNLERNVHRAAGRATQARGRISGQSSRLHPRGRWGLTRSSRLFRSGLRSGFATFSCGSCLTTPIHQPSKDPRIAPKSHPWPLHHAAIARRIGTQELQSHQADMRALQEEAEKLQARDTWELNSVKEWAGRARDAEHKGMEILVGRIFFIVVEKNA